MSLLFKNIFSFDKEQSIASNNDFPNKNNHLEWDPFRHWLAVTSILLIAGAAGVAVPLALRVAAGKISLFCKF